MVLSNLPARFLNLQTRTSKHLHQHWTKKSMDSDRDSQKTTTARFMELRRVFLRRQHQPDQQLLSLQPMVSISNRECSSIFSPAQMPRRTPTFKSLELLQTQPA